MSDFIDLRSDTVTKPNAEMNQAIQDAPLGDDVIGDCPTINELQRYTAELLGKEAAIFMPSGTMTNQIALRVHCKPGDEFICEAGCHVYNYEQGAFAQLSGLMARTVPGDNGVLHVDQLQDLIMPDNEHFCVSKLVCLENTHNRGGGCVQPYDNVEDICNWAHENGLKTHLDGARLFNAVAASGISAATWAQHFDTVSICFSKGLGAPVGSALVGPADMIAQARRHRKAFGGGMRQAGVIAAGALYAMQNNRERMTIDHENAQLIAEVVRNTDGIRLLDDQVDTNIVIFLVDDDVTTAATLAGALGQKNVHCLALGPQRIRMVTHLDVSTEQVEHACSVLSETVAEFIAGVATDAPAGAQY